jgi:death-on-curing protein
LAEYLTFDDVLYIHSELRKRLGLEPAPLRDEEALRGVVKLPEAAAHYEGADPILQAAVLAVGIAHLKPFVAGNYRTAYATMETFLDLNGYTVDAEATNPSLDTYLRLMAGEHEYQQALAYFTAQMRRAVRMKA